jgi:hypothetical protein
MRADLAYTSKFSPRWHHKESDTANLAADVTASIEAAAAAAIASIKSAADTGIPQLLSDDTIDHVINAAESTGVDVTAAGLGHGASGTMTFTDAADHQLVDVAGNGSYTAGLTDGTISSSLRASDGAGHANSLSGNSVLLDTNKGLSPTLPVNAVNPTYVPAGETLELASPYSGTLSFAGATGTLKIDNSSSFSGTIAGQLAIGDVIDLADITAGAGAKISYSGNNSPGTLTVSDGTHTASIALLGNYSVANFTASSDGHGGTSVVDPPVLPAGVTLQQIDGGPTYYTSHGFTNAVNMGWDNPNFFPIGPFDSRYVSQTDVNTWSALGWNTAFADGGITLSLAGSYGISVIEQNLSGSFGSNVVGLLSQDEPSTFAQGVSGPLGSTANSVQDGRFWWMNDTWAWVWGQGLSGAPGSGTPASILSDLITTPDGTTRHIDINSIDMYWFAGSRDPSWSGYMTTAGKYIYNLSSGMTTDQSERGSNYGDMIDIIRSYQAGSNPAPIFSIIEDGQPFTGSTNGSTYITPAELNWATWSSLIHGARGVIYFDHSFSGPGTDNVDVANSYFQTVQPGQTISIDGQITATDALIKQLAPVINSPFAMNYVTVNGPHYSYGTPDLTLGGLEVMAKDDNGQFYIFADTRDSETQTNISATFTIADKNATSVTVVNENRTIAVVNGVFADTFATAATVHIYEVNDSGVAPPPTAPAAPTIASFSTDSGVVGDHITNDSTPTLTGTAVANSTVTVFDGTTQVGTGTANSSGAWTITTTKLVDGSHSFTATDTVSGVTSAASSALSVTVDTVAPSAPVETGASIVSGTTKVQLTGTAEANSTLQVFDGTTQVGTATANSSGAWSLTTGTLAGGGHSFTATATDAAGNSSLASAALAVTIPSAPTAPAAPTIASFSPDTGVVGDGITDANQLTLTGTAVANSTVTVFDGSAQIGTTTANSSGSWSSITSVLTDAIHLLTATDTVSGVTSAASSPLSVTVDTHVPAAPVLVSDPIVNTNHVVLSGTAEANSAITVYDGTTVVGTGTTNSTGNWNVTTTALSSGMNALTATATDVAGNVSAVSQPLDPVINSPPPAAPQITSFSIDSGIVGDHITNDNTPTLTGTAVANSTVEVFDGTTQIGMATANGSGQWTLTTPVLSDGTHSLTANDTDSSGHTSALSAAFSVTIDTHTPGAPTMAVYSQGGSAVGSTTTLNDLVLKGTAEANSTIDILDSGKQIGTANTSGAGAWSFDTGSLATGSHSFTAQAVDVAGTIGTSSPADVTSVTAPPTPAPTPIEFTNVAYSLSNHTATINGTADAYSQIKLYDGTTSLGTVTASANGTWSLTNSYLSNTLHTIKAQELDSTGHVVETSSGAVILAASNTSTLTGTGGDDFLFSSSSTVNDTFVFASNFGHSTIEGFTATGSGRDIIQFSKSVFDSFASVLSHASQTGQDVVISADASDSLTLKNTNLSALQKHDFHFA